MACTLLAVAAVAGVGLTKMWLGLVRALDDAACTPPS